MAYMVYQQLITAIEDSYRAREDASEQARTAAEYCDWLGSLVLDPKLKAPLVEQAAAIEAALRSSSAGT